MGHKAIWSTVALLILSTSDWASQLVTVRNETTLNIPFPHVLLTFGFDTAVSLTGIEMDFFNCPDWNISAPSITVYLNPDYNLTATTNILFSLPFVFAYVNSLQSSCDSLSTVTISGGSFKSGSYHTVCILVDLWLCLRPTPPSSPSTLPLPVLFSLPKSCEFF